MNWIILLFLNIIVAISAVYLGLLLLRIILALLIAVIGMVSGILESLMCLLCSDSKRKLVNTVILIACIAIGIICSIAKIDILSVLKGWLL